MLTDSNNQWS